MSTAIPRVHVWKLEGNSLLRFFRKMALSWVNTARRSFAFCSWNRYMPRRWSKRWNSGRRSAWGLLLSEWQCQQSFASFQNRDNCLALWTKFCTNYNCWSRMRSLSDMLLLQRRQTSLYCVTYINVPCCGFVFVFVDYQLTPVGRRMSNCDCQSSISDISMSSPWQW